MFKSIEFTENPMGGYWKIIDDDFEEYGVGSGVWSMTDATIKIYEKNKLNVPKNLILLFKCFENIYRIGTVLDCFELVQNIEPIQPYKEKLEKLLVIS